MSRLLKPLLLAIAALLPTAVSSAAPKNLLKAASDHFEIYTTDNEAAAKAAIVHFETARAYLMARFKTGDPFETPVRIFGFKSHGDFSSSLPKGAAAEHAFSKATDAGAFILMEGLTKESYEYGMKEYVDIFLARSFPRMPFWLRLGFDQFYSTLQTGEGTVKVGEAPHLAYRAGSAPTLNSSAMALVMGLRPGDVKGQDKQADAFAASNNNKALPSGTQGMDTIADSLTQDYPTMTLHLVRMFMFNKTYSPKFWAGFVSALEPGGNSAATLNDVYGQSLTGLAQDLGLDYKQASHPVLTQQFALPRAIEPKIAELSAADSATLLAEIKNSK